MPNIVDADPGVSGVSKDKEKCGKSKIMYFQVDHPLKVE